MSASVELYAVVVDRDGVDHGQPHFLSRATDKPVTSSKLDRAFAKPASFALFGAQAKPSVYAWPAALL
jgi:hypothetical protein